MINQAELNRLYDCEVIDEKGERIGSVKQVWLDDDSGQPMWASVHTGMFGLKESFVPLQDARMGQGSITVQVDKQQVKDAPKIDVDDQHMSEEQQDELYSYYGLIPTANTGEHDRMGKRPTGRQGAAETGRRGMTGREGDSVTRYEEQLDVGTRNVEAGRVRLVKHTVTEQKDVTVPVSHEEVRVVREPADPNTATGRDAFTDQEAEITLRREEPVAETHTRPVERVRLEKETVTGQEKVGGQVRKEQVEVEDESGTMRRDQR